MKSILTTKTSIVLAALFIWLDALGILRGSVGNSAGVEAALVFIAINSYFAESFFFGAAFVLGAGIVMDSLSPVPVYTVTFAIMFYVSLILKQKFYNPGSPTHVMSFAAAFAVTRFFLFMAGNGYGSYGGIPIVQILIGAMMDFALFAALIFLLRKRDVTVMYKMR